MLDIPPKPFDEDVVQRPAAAIHADADFVLLENVDEVAEPRGGWYLWGSGTGRILALLRRICEAPNR